MSEWVEWKGGECPVPGDTLVEVRIWKGNVKCNVAEAFWWDHRGDIVAYRVVNAPPVGRGWVSAVETLRRAADLIELRGKQRDSDAGERSMARTVAAFNAVYGASLTETQGAYVADDLDAKVAYAALAAECEAGARGRTD